MPDQAFRADIGEVQDGKTTKLCKRCGGADCRKSRCKGHRCGVPHPAGPAIGEIGHGAVQRCLCALYHHACHFNSRAAGCSFQIGFGIRLPGPRAGVPAHCPDSRHCVRGGRGGVFRRAVLGGGSPQRNGREPGGSPGGAGNRTVGVLCRVDFGGPRLFSGTE